MKDKRPVVYVARKLTYFNKVEEVCGYYVSKAYLNFVGKCYEKDGSISKEFIVDFVNDLEMMEFAEDIYAETDRNVSKTEAFSSFDDCKKFVNQQNYELLNIEGRVPRSARVVMYKKAINHGEKLEQRYIPLEKRKTTVPQQVSCEEEFFK